MNYIQKIIHLVFQAEGFKYSGDIIDSLNQKGVYQIKGYQAVNPRRNIENNQQFILENYHLDREIKNLISENKWDAVKLLSIAGLDYNHGITKDFFNFIFAYLHAKSYLNEEINSEIIFLATNNSYYFYSKYSHDFGNITNSKDPQNLLTWWQSLSFQWQQILFDNYEISQGKGNFQLIQEQGNNVSEDFIDSILNLEYLHIINPVVGNFHILSHFNRLENLHIYLYNNCLLSGINEIQNLKNLTISVGSSPWYRTKHVEGNIENEDFYSFSGDQENEDFDFGNILKCNSLQELSLRGSIRNFSQLNSLGGFGIKKLIIIIDNLRMSLQSYLSKDDLAKINVNTDIGAIEMKNKSYEADFKLRGDLWIKEKLDSLFDGISNFHQLIELEVFVDYNKEGGVLDKDVFPFIYDMHTLQFSDMWGMKLKNLRRVKLNGEIWDYQKLRGLLPNTISIEL